MYRPLFPGSLRPVSHNVHFIQHHALAVPGPKAQMVDRWTGLAAKRNFGKYYSLRCSENGVSAPINKEHGGTVMTHQLYGYLLSHTHEHEVLCDAYAKLTGYLTGHQYHTSVTAAGAEVATKPDRRAVSSRSTYASVT